MSLQDPIADMLTRIRNGQMAKHQDVALPHSMIKENIAKVLQKEGFILGFSVDDELKKTLSIQLKYEDLSRRKPVIRKISRMSKPSLRVYMGYQDIPYIKERMGVVILTTPVGIITGKEARRKKIGGEVLAVVE